MTSHLERLAAERGLGTLSADVLAIDAAPTNPQDRFAVVGALTNFDEAIKARIRRGPDPAGDALIRAYLEGRPRELALFEADAQGAAIGAMEHPVTGARTFADWLMELGEGPPMAPGAEPALLMEQLRTFDLGAAWQLATTEAGRSVLRDLREELLAFAETLERAHCPRWALGFLMLLDRLDVSEAFPRALEVLLDAGAWAEAIVLAERPEGGPFRAYVAARAPARALGERDWAGDLASADALAPAIAAIDAAPDQVSRAQAARVLALAEAGADVGLERLHRIVARFPTWRHAHRVRAKVFFASDGPEAQAPGVIESFLASFGADASLFAALRPVTSPAARQCIDPLLVREVCAYPDWVEAWRALAYFTVNDLGTASRLLLALKRPHA